MEKIILGFDYWKELDKHIKEKYPNKVIFLNDNNLSFFDTEEIPINPNVFSFKDVDEFTSFIDSDDAQHRVNIVGALSVLWINGNRNTSVIYKLRG